jgi:hypothetical protein
MKPHNPKILLQSVKTLNNSSNLTPHFAIQKKLHFFDQLPGCVSSISFQKRKKFVAGFGISLLIFGNIISSYPKGITVKSTNSSRVLSTVTLSFSSIIPRYISLINSISLPCWELTSPTCVENKSFQVIRLILESLYLNLPTSSVIIFEFRVSFIAVCSVMIAPLLVSSAASATPVILRAIS